MSRLSIKAIVVGGLADVLSSFVLAIPVAAVAGSRGVELSHKWKLIEMILGLTCSVFGGYIAGRIAKQDKLLNGLLSSWLCTVLGVFGLIFGVVHHSVWLDAFNFIAAPICALLGGYLARPRTNPEFA